MSMGLMTCDISLESKFYYSRYHRWYQTCSRLHVLSNPQTYLYVNSICHPTAGLISTLENFWWLFWVKMPHGLAFLSACLFPILRYSLSRSCSDLSNLMD